MKATVIAGREHVQNARLLSLRSMLKLEIKGLRRRGRSACSIIKAELGFKGSKERVLEQLNAHIDNLGILPKN